MTVELTGVTTGQLVVYILSDLEWCIIQPMKVCHPEAISPPPPKSMKIADLGIENTLHNLTDTIKIIYNTYCMKRTLQDIFSCVDRTCQCRAGMKGLSVPSGASPSWKIILHGKVSLGHVCMVITWESRQIQGGEGGH